MVGKNAKLSKRALKVLKSKRLSDYHRRRRQQTEAREEKKKSERASVRCRAVCCSSQNIPNQVPVSVGKSVESISSMSQGMFTDNGQVPVEQVGQLNFDDGFDALPDVLDIKVEEPEVTCSTKDDYTSALLDHSYSRIKEEPFCNEYTASPECETQSSFETVLTKITNQIENDNILPSQNVSKPSESQNRIDANTKTIAVSIKCEPEEYNVRNESPTSQTQPSFSRSTRKRRRGRKNNMFSNEHNYTRSHRPNCRAKKARVSNDGNIPDSVKVDGTVKSKIAGQPRKRSVKGRLKSITSPDTLRRSPRIKRSVSDNQEAQHAGNIKLEVKEFDWRDHVLEVRKKKISEQQDDKPQKVKSNESEKNLPLKVGFDDKQRILVSAVNSSNPVIMGHTENPMVATLHRSHSNELVGSTPILASNIGNSGASQNKLLGKIVKIRCNPGTSITLNQNGSSMLPQIEPMTFTIIPTPKSVSNFPFADPLSAGSINSGAINQIPSQTLPNIPQGNKFIEIKGKDDTVIKTVEVHKIGPRPKKPSCGLRVKTQDELNASVSLLIDADQAPETPVLSHPPASCFMGSTNVDLANSNTSGTVRKPTKITTFPTTRPFHQAEAGTSGTFSNSIKATMVMSDDNGKTVKKFVIPINRMLESVPDSLWELFETKSSTAQPQPQPRPQPQPKPDPVPLPRTETLENTEKKKMVLPTNRVFQKIPASLREVFETKTQRQSKMQRRLLPKPQSQIDGRTLGNTDLQRDGKISKDVSGKRIKNMGKTAKIVITKSTFAKEDDSLKAKGIKYPKIASSNQNVTVDMETLLPSHSIVKSTTDNNVTILNHPPKNLSSTDDNDEVVILDSEDEESSDNAVPQKQTLNITKTYFNHRPKERNQYHNKSKDKIIPGVGQNLPSYTRSASEDDAVQNMQVTNVSAADSHCHSKTIQVKPFNPRENPTNDKELKTLKNDVNKKITKDGNGSAVVPNIPNPQVASKAKVDDALESTSKSSSESDVNQKGANLKNPSSTIPSQTKMKKTIVISLAKSNKQPTEVSTMKSDNTSSSLLENLSKVSNPQGNPPLLNADVTNNSKQGQSQEQIKPSNVKSPHFPKPSIVASEKPTDLHILGESEEDSDELPVIRIQDLEAFLGNEGQNQSTSNQLHKDSIIDLLDDSDKSAGNNDKNIDDNHETVHDEVGPIDVPEKALSVTEIVQEAVSSSQDEVSKVDDPCKNIDTSENSGSSRKDASDSNPVEFKPFLDSNLRRSGRLCRKLPSSSSGVSDNITIESKNDGIPPVPKEILENDISELIFTSNLNYCRLCEKECENLSSHLQMVHALPEEVQQFLQSPKGSDTRRNILRKWYFIANLAVIVEANPWGSKLCALCRNYRYGFQHLCKHYFQCESLSYVTWQENLELIFEEEVNSDLNRLMDELREKFDLAALVNLERAIFVSLFLLNDGLSGVDKLSVSDYGRRRPLDIEKDLLLIEMIGNLPKVEDHGQLKIMASSNMLTMPVFLTQKQEEAINLLLFHVDNQYPSYKNLGLPASCKERCTLAQALEYYGGKEVAKPSKEKRKKGRGKKTGWTRVKGTAHCKKTRPPESVIEKEPMDVSDDENNDGDVNPAPNIESTLRPVWVVLTRCDIAMSGTNGNISEDTESRPISRSSESSSATPSSNEARSKSPKPVEQCEINEGVKAKRICRNKNFKRSFYLSSRKNSSTNKRTKVLIDSRDIGMCKGCRKYYRRHCYLKHIKRCAVKIANDSKKRRLGKDPRGKYRTRTSTCPTLQSAAGVKKYFCIFCKQTFTKLNRHLEHKHKDEEEVREMLRYPKRSRERQQILYKLRTRGTFTFNKNSEYNGGKIIVSRRPHPTLQRTSRDFLPCPSCGNYFAKKTLYRHSKRCSKKEGLQKDLRRTALALITRVHPKCNKIMANQVIPRLVVDNVSEAIKNDELLILFGNHLTRKHHTPNIRKGYIRQNLRIVGKLFLAMRNLNESIQEFSQMYNPEYCGSVLKGLLDVAGYNLETKTFKLPEIARKLGKIVKTCGEVWSMECSKRKRFEDRRMVMDFLHRFEQIYKNDVLTKLIPRPSSKLQTNDLRKKFQSFQTRMIEAAEKLKKDFSYDVWLDLANSSLAYLRLLNNNIVQDGASLYVSDYLQRHSMDSDEDCISYHTLGLLSNFPKNYLKVKLQTSSTWLLLSQEFCNAVDVLLENREDAGVPIENVYLFGVPEHKDQHFKSSDANNYLKIRTSSQIQLESKEVKDKVVEAHEEVKQQNSSDETKNSNTTYMNNLRKAFDHHSNRMVELTMVLRQKFSNQVWIELIKCVLTCVQLMNDTTFAEVVQYLLLIDYNDRNIVNPDEDLSIFNSFVNLDGVFYQLKMRETPITLLLSSTICEALDLLIQTRSLANIDPENPYVFGCSGNKYNYYRTEGCIGSLPVNDGVEEILTLRCKIINNLIKNGSAGLELWKFLPESKEDMKDNAIKVFYYSQSKMVELMYKLEEKFYPEIWLELVRCLLTYLHLLNNRCPEDAEKTLIADVLHVKRQHLELNEDKGRYHCLDDLSDFPQNYLKARVGQGEHFLLLSLDFCATLDVLLSHRTSAGVHVDNPYVFGCRGNKENYFRAHGAIAHVATKCGVKRLKYDRAKKVNGKIEIQEQIVDVKDISRAEREILLNDWKIERMMKAADQKLITSTKKRESNPIPRRRWTEEEMSCVFRNFTNCLTKGYLPSIYQCQQVINENAELSGRTPEQLKAWVNNQIQKQSRHRGQETNVQGDSGVTNAVADSPVPPKHAPRVRWSEAEQSLISVIGKTKSKRSKRELTLLKSECLWDYHRSSGQQAEVREQFPTELVGQLNFDHGFDVPPDVLDIEMEESELTRNAKDDFSPVVLDHSYSSTTEERFSNEEYVTSPESQAKSLLKAALTENRNEIQNVNVLSQNVSETLEFQNRIYASTETVTVVLKCEAEEYNVQNESGNWVFAQGNKFIEIEGKDDTVTEPVEYHNIGPVPKKRSCKLRIKTQDELNASASLFVDANQASETPVLPNPPASCLTLANSDASDALLKPTFPITRPSNLAEAGTSGTLSNDKLIVVIPDDTGETMREFVLPINRLFESPADSLREMFQTKFSIAQAQPQSQSQTYGGTLGNIGLQDDRRISKDVTGKRIKNRRSTLAKIAVTQSTFAKEDNSLQSKESNETLNIYSGDNQMETSHKTPSRTISSQTEIKEIMVISPAKPSQQVAKTPMKNWNNASSLTNVYVPKNSEKVQGRGQTIPFNVEIQHFPRSSIVVPQNELVVLDDSEEDSDAVPITGQPCNFVEFKPVLDSNLRRSGRLYRKLPHSSSGISNNTTIESKDYGVIVGNEPEEENTPVPREILENDISELIFTSNLSYCKLCEKECENLSSHLQMVHIHQGEVQEFLQSPKGSDVRRNILRKWYFIANLSAIVEANPWGYKLCSLCRKPRYGFQDFCSHYFHCESTSHIVFKENLELISKEQVNSDLSHLVEEIRENFDPKALRNLERAICVSLFFLNDGLIGVNKLSILDYGRRRRLDVEKDLLLIEMIGNLSKIEDHGQLKIMAPSNMLAMPVFLTQQQEEAINLFLFHLENQYPSCKCLGLPESCKERYSLAQALEYYGGKEAAKPSIKKRKRRRDGKIKGWKRVKGKAHSKRIRFPESVIEKEPMDVSDDKSIFIYENLSNGKEPNTFQSNANKKITKDGRGSTETASVSNNYVRIGNISKLPVVNTKIDDILVSKSKSFTESNETLRIYSGQMKIVKPNIQVVETSTKNRGSSSLLSNLSRVNDSQGNVSLPNVGLPTISEEIQSHRQTIPSNVESQHLPNLSVAVSHKLSDLHVLEESGEDSDELPVFGIQDLETFLGKEGQNQSTSNQVQKIFITDSLDDSDKSVGSSGKSSDNNHQNVHDEVGPNDVNEQAESVAEIVPEAISSIEDEMSGVDDLYENIDTSENIDSSSKDASDSNPGEFKPVLDSTLRRSGRIRRRLHSSKNGVSDSTIIESNGDGVVVANIPEDENTSVPKEILENDISELIFTSNLNYCGLCKKECESLSSHLQMVHIHQGEVQEFLQSPKGSGIRRNILKKWYLIANLAAIIEANPWGSKYCWLCRKFTYGYEDLCSHYFQCESTRQVGCKEKLRLVSKEEVDSDLKRLVDEVRENFDPEILMKLERVIIVSLSLLNDGLTVVDTLSIFDYDRRRPLDIEKDFLLIEMIGNLPKIEDHGQLKIMAQSNVLNLPLLLTQKQEEAFNVLVFQAENSSRKFLISRFNIKCRFGLGKALEYYCGEVVQLPRRKKRRGTFYFSRIKGKRRAKKIRPSETESVDASNEQNNDDAINLIPNTGTKYTLRPEPPVLTRCDIATSGEYPSADSGNTSTDTESRPISRTSEMSLFTTSCDETSNETPKSMDQCEINESVKTMTICRNKNFKRSFYLRSRKNSSANKRTKVVMDSRDIGMCKGCRKYYRKHCYLKHIRRCPLKIANDSKRTRLGEDSGGKHRTRISTCPTLQSAAGVKKYFCIFCKQTFTKLNRHLEYKHKDEEEVKEMLKYPKRSRERQQILYKLRTRGTFTFNKNLKYNAGKIIVSRRPHPTLQRTSRDFLPCPYCGNYFAKKTLYRHSKRCSKKEGLQKDLRRTALALITKVHPKCNKIMANLIIPRLVDDNVSEAIKSDELLILFGNHLTRKHYTPHYVRQNLRIGGKFFLVVKNLNESIKEFSQMYNTEYCDSVLKGLLDVAGYNLETKTFKLPELVRKSGKIINICGEVWRTECSERKRFEDRRMAMEFLHRFEEIYKNDVLTKLTHRPTTKDFQVQTKDLRKRFQLVETIMIEAAEKLKQHFSYDTWLDLANSSLAHLRLLNNNVVQDGASPYISDYLQRQGLDSNEDSTSYSTLGLLSNFPKNYFKLKLQISSISLLVSQEFCNAVDVLLENRNDAGVPIENVYLFGFPEQKDQPKPNEADNYVKITTNSSITYKNSLGKAFDHQSNKMIELTIVLSKKFSKKIWIELIKCVLTCVQLMNDATIHDVVQYLLLIDYNDRNLVNPGEDLSIYNSFVNLDGVFYKLKMRETPITLLLSSTICEALDLLIQTRSLANIDSENPYVFGCSGSKNNYYRTEGCIGSLPVNDGVEEILTLRCKIINDLIRNGSAGLELWKFLPENKGGMRDNTVKVFYYSQSKMMELMYKLEEEFCLEIWLELVECLLAYFHFLNNCCPEDVEKTLIADVLPVKRQQLELDDDMQRYHCIDDLSDFPQNYLKARLGQSEHFLLLSLDFCAILDVLLSHRTSAQVHVDNPYVFACRGNKESYFRAHGAIAHVATKCGVRRLKYNRAKKVNGKIVIQEEIVDLKDIERDEREILSNDWRIEKMKKATESNPNQKKRWTEEEKSCAAKNFGNFLANGILPNHYQCQQVIDESVELSGRTPEQLRGWLNNQIQKLKSPDAKYGPTTRVRWSEAERRLVKSYFSDNFLLKSVPSGADCQKLVASHPELSNRTPSQLRCWIYSQINKSEPE